jgi:hypothetical protein
LVIAAASPSPFLVDVSAAIPTLRLNIAVNNVTYQQINDTHRAEILSLVADTLAVPNNSVSLVFMR